MSDYFLQNLLLFTRTLRRVGLPAAPEQSMELAQALTLVDVGNREQVFHAARCLLVTRQEHLRLFETIFNRFWRVHDGRLAGQGQRMPIAPRHRRPPKPRYDIVSLMAAKARPGDREIEVADKAETFSSMEVLHTKEFAQMTDEELEAVKRLIQEIKWPISRRVTRRRVPDKQGSTLHLRQLLRAATKYGGIPLQLSWQSRKIKQRPIILIADISGSMEKYARLVLQFFYSVAHSLKDVESFVFGTRLTRITAQLKLKNIDIAIDDAAREVMDWAGGTRIGDSLRIFNQQWSRRVLRRGALVIIISDGWERGDVSLLRQEMRYLQHRCHRLIWLNPLSGKTTYQPRVEGMAAAMPFVDDFLPIHNLQSLSELAQHLAALE